MAVVDDHPVYRAGVRAVLSSAHGVQVVAEAGDAREAYAAVRAARPDLVLLDFTLPGPDGLSAARELLRRHPESRLLMLAPKVEETIAVDALAAGARGCLGKDQPIRELLAAVHAVGAGHTYLPPTLSPAVVQARLRRGQAGPLGTLSARERDVFDLLVRGFNNAEVAERLEISRRTVETHRSRILKKLGVHSAAELIRLAARHGLIRS